MLIAADIAASLDPCLFAEQCGIDPDPWQADLLRARPRKALLNCSRQSGKTTVAALMGLETACYLPGCTVLISAPAQRQSGEMLRTIKRLHTANKNAPPLIEESAVRVTLETGSRLWAIPGSPATVRGIAAPAIIICDELAYAPDDLVHALWPMLATTNGPFIGLSTPNFKAGYFYETFRSRDPSWTRVEIPASKCLRISRAFLEEQMTELGPVKYRSEYECEFADLSGAVFSGAIIDSIFRKDIPAYA
jgi:hypothetical protein